MGTTEQTVVPAADAADRTAGLSRRFSVLAAAFSIVGIQVFFSSFRLSIIRPGWRW